MGKIKQILAFLFVILLLVPSCTKETIYLSSDDSMKEIVSPTGFDFAMTNRIGLSVQLPATVSYSSVNRIIEVWSETTDGKPDKLIKTGSADHNGLYKDSITVPSTAKRLFVYCFAGWRSFNIQGSGVCLSDGMIAVDYNMGYGNSVPRAKSGYLASSTMNRVPATPKKHTKSLDNGLSNGTFSVNRLGTINTWSASLPADGMWYATDEARAYGSIISVEGNSFARISSPQYSSGGFTQLIEAHPGQIISFTGESRGFDSQQNIYFYLIPRNQEGEILQAFSFNLVNPGINWTEGTVSGTMPEGTTSCQVLFFKGSTGIVDFDNAEIQITETGQDRDGDGVLDLEDSYPDDQKLAFDDYYPAKDKPGTLAFEDLWPSQGDYDFNDLILDYQINRISNARNQVVAINVITQVRAIGGSIRNGFGFQLNLNPAQIVGVQSEYPAIDHTISLNNNGTESGQKLATFILFTDAYQVVTHAGDGSPTLNTTMGYRYVTPTEKQFTIFLKDPLDPNLITINKINPFIFRQNDRSHEIHLVGFPPTDLANPDLFGTGCDATDEAAGIYYQTKNGLPWAMNIPIQFDYTIEKEDILKGFPNLRAWISSGGYSKADWYQDKQGYRDWTYIYRW